MDDDDLVETSRLPRGDDVKSWRPSGRAGGFRGFCSKRGSLHSAADIQELVVDRIHSDPPHRHHTPSHLISTYQQWLPSIRPAGLADYRASRQWMVGDVLLIPTSPFLNTFLFWTQPQITTGRALPRFSCSTVALTLRSPPPLPIPIHHGRHQRALRPRPTPLPLSSPISRLPLVLLIPATARRATYPAHPMPSWSSVLGSGTRIT